jgi:hypothetical protein
LRTRETEPQPRNHFIEDQHCAGRLRPRLQALEETGVGLYQAHVTDHRFDHDCREPVADARQVRVDVGEIVVARDRKIVRHRARNPRMLRPIGMRRRAGVLQRQIEVAVIVAGKLEDRIAAGERARDARPAPLRSRWS